MMHILNHIKNCVAISSVDRKFICAAHAGDQRLWKLWWLWGIPVGWTVSGLIILAEVARVAGYTGWADLLDVMRLLIFFSWARLAWRCSHQVRDRRWPELSAGLGDE